MSVCSWLKRALLVCRTASSLLAEHLTKERPVLLVLPSWELLLASGSHRVFSLLFPTPVQTLQHSSLPESPLQLRDSKNKWTYIHTHAEHRKPKKPLGILHPSTAACFLCCCWLHFGQAYSITEKAFTGICIDCTPQLPNYLFQDFSGAVPSAKYQSVYQAYAHGIYGLRDNRDSKLGLNFPHVEATYPWNTQHQSIAVYNTVLHPSSYIPYTVYLSYHGRLSAPQDGISSGKLWMGKIVWIKIIIKKKGG